MKLDVTRKGYYEIWIEGDIKKSTQHSSITEALASGLEFKYNNLDKKVTLKQPNLEFEVDLDNSADIELLKLKIEELERKEIMYLSIINNLKSNTGNGSVTPVDSSLAFPSAIGAGAYTTGGRGGQIIHVTTTADNGDNNNPTSGSLREALLTTGAKNIVFDVSGAFDFSANTDSSLYKLYTENSDVTIAGQTAPEGGVTFIGGRIYFANVDNLIVRHVRFKGGNEQNLNSYVSASNLTNQIFDHVSFGFGFTMPTWYSSGGTSDANVDKITIQNCLFSETIKGAIIGKKEDKIGNVGDISFLRNVFYNAHYRFPNLAGFNTSDKGFDIVNNLAWKNTGRLSRGNGDINLNHLNNSYYFGSTAVQNTGVNSWAEGDYPNIYTSGNTIFATNEAGDLSSSVSQMNTDNNLMWRYFVGDNYGNQLPSNYFTNTQFSIKGKSYNIYDSANLKTELLDNVGCNSRLNADGSVSSNLDIYDSSYIKNMKDDVFVTELTSGEFPIPTITSNSRPANFYVSNPHIPEAFLVSRGLTGTATIHSDIAPSGYTWFEEYINSVA